MAVSVCFRERLAERPKGTIGMYTTWLIVIAVVVIISIIDIAVTVEQARDEERGREGS